MIVFASHYPNGAPFKDFISTKVKNNRKAYIPAFSSSYLDYIKNKRKGLFAPIDNLFNKEDIHNEHTFYLDEPIDEDKLFSHGIIEIGGGNTFTLLSMLRSVNIRDKLKQYEENGGVLVGSSAGAVVMGVTTLLSTIADDNLDNITNFTGLNMIENFTPMCFKPHADMYKNYDVLFQSFADSHNINVVTGTENAYLIFDKDEAYYTDGIKVYSPANKQES